MYLKLFTVFALFATPTAYNAQIVINEVDIKPPTSSSSSQYQSLKVCTQPTYGREYVELYNTSCNTVDIGCYFIGYRIYSSSLDGTFRFPAGTSIAPHGFISIGGPNSGATFSMADYCSDAHLETGSDRWYMDNGDFYIALYDASGAPQNAVYWTTSSGQSSKWGTDSDLDEPPTYTPSPGGCSVVASLPGPTSASLTAVAEYAGTAPSMGDVSHRTEDGGATWANNGTPSINASNNVADPCTTLPVDLLGFDFTCSANRITLEWQTSAEFNNDYFDIQYTENGYDFESVGRLSGAGNSSNYIEYSYQIPSVIQAGYFRLKQVDYNGAFEYSDVIHVNCSGNQPMVQVVNGQLLISNVEEVKDCIVYDLSGRVVHNSPSYQSFSPETSSSFYYVHLETPLGSTMHKIFFQ